MNFGLKKRDIDNLHNAFEQFDEIGQVIIFGSRAKGNSKPASDIDIAVKGSRIDSQIILRLKDMLDELPLPYFFDVVDYGTITNQNLKDHIDRVGKIIYEKV